MTDKPTDAVAQARDAVFAQMKTLASPSFDAARLAQAFQRYESTLIAAVRAECAAKVDDAISEGLVVEAMNYASERQVQDHSSPFALCVASHIACEVAAALEAQP